MQACFLCAVVAGLTLAQTPAPKTVARVGHVVPEFKLPDSTGKTYSLSDFQKQKAIVVIFLGTQCPINNAYLPRLAEMHASLAKQDVALLGINSNCNDTPAAIAQQVQKETMPFPVLRDAGNKVADLFRAERTPEAFVLSREGKVLYRGRIDDQFGYRHRRDAATQTELLDAVADVLAGKSVRKPETAVEGCFIARVVDRKTDGAITYHRDIAPLIQKNCQECHRPNQIGPMALLSYNDVVDWSATIREVVEERRMPPWHADPKHGVFENNRRLADAERKMILDWIDSGMAEGKTTEEPAPVPFVEGWRIGKPDVVFEMPTTFTVPPKTTRASIKYQYFVVETNFKEDMWVQAAEAKPGNRQVVHHIIVYVKTPGQNRAREDGIGDGFLVPYAPGDMPSVFPTGTAKKIAKGAVLVFQMHYTPTATEEKDRSSVALIFSKTPPLHEVRTRSIAQRRLAIPAGDANHKVTSTTKFPRDVRLLSLLPHMHLRGKSFEYRAIFPDGKEQMLLSVPEYDFNWQTVYRLKEPLNLPAGTRIDCTAYFDNSAGNKNNPDPKKLVRWGEQTWEEMMIGFIDYVYLDTPEKK